MKLPQKKSLTGTRSGYSWRWCRRQPALATLAAAVVTLLLAVTAVSVAAGSMVP